MVLLLFIIEGLSLSYNNKNPLKCTKNYPELKAQISFESSNFHF